jgi:hypothetical protein
MVGSVPADFTATLGGIDGSGPLPWRASYVVSVGMSGGARLLYAIDHPAALPWVWRVPVRARRRHALARLVLASGILIRNEATRADDRRAGAWLCASTGPVRRVVPLEAIPGGNEIAEAFRELVPASVWGLVAERRAAFMAAHTASRESGSLRGTLGGECR